MKEKLNPTGEIRKGIKQFILGGSADFSIHQEPDKTYKYYIKSNEEGNTWFIYIGRKYQGYIKKIGGKYSFFVGSKGNLKFDNNAINGLLWVLNKGDNLPDIVHVYHHGKCSVCGRKLTDPESLNCGVGPTCRERLRQKGILI